MQLAACTNFALNSAHSSIRIRDAAPTTLAAPARATPPASTTRPPETRDTLPPAIAPHPGQKEFRSRLPALRQPESFLRHAARYPDPLETSADRANSRRSNRSRQP